MSQNAVVNFSPDPGSVEIREIDCPEPDIDDVIIKVEAVGVWPVNQRKPPAPPPPPLLAAETPGEPPPPPAPTGPTQAELDAARADSIARVQAEEARQREAELVEQERLATARDEARSTLEDMVNFDYDESAITAEAETILLALTKC